MVENGLLQFYDALSWVKPARVCILSFGYASGKNSDWAEVKRDVVGLEHLLATIVDDQVHVVNWLMLDLRFLFK